MPSGCALGSPAVPCGARSSSITRRRRTDSSSISSCLIRARPIANRPMAVARMATAPTAIAPSANAPTASAPVADAPRARGGAAIVLNGECARVLVSWLPAWHKKTNVKAQARLEVVVWTDPLGVSLVTRSKPRKESRRSKKLCRHSMLRGEGGLLRRRADALRTRRARQAGRQGESLPSRQVGSTGRCGRATHIAVRQQLGARALDEH